MCSFFLPLNYYIRPQNQNMRILPNLLLLMLLSSINCISQISDPANDAVSKYFQFDRETIYLHLNKNTYLNDETIWFKGYITEKKSSRPYGNTVNVYTQLVDESGKQLQLNLHFAENSTFEGHIDLDKNLSTGTYFIRTYTYFMNNFIENESSVYRISILNPTDNKIVNSKKNNYASAEMELFPESGVLLQGIQNTIGVKITDCNENGIAISNAIVQDSKGNNIVTFATNESGYGRFDLSPKADEIYKVVYEIDGNKQTKLLPPAIISGIALTVNNYVFPDKTVLKAKSNDAFLSQMEDLSIIMLHGSVVERIPLSFKNNIPELTIVIPTNQFSSGITTFYIVDKQQNKLAERVVFTPETIVPNIDISIRENRGDSVVVAGFSNLKMANLSVSVLPSATISLNDENSISGTLVFDNVLSSSIKNASYYYNNRDNRKIRYELDNILLTKNSKYNWNTIIQNKIPEIKYAFESGLSVKGTVNIGNADKKDLRIKMTQFAGDQVVQLNEKNEFFFNHLAAVDSTLIHFTLLRRQKTTPLKMYPQLVNANRTFNKPFLYKMRYCTFLEDTQETDFPTVEGAIALKEVGVQANKTAPLINESRYGNAMAKGYKITDDEATTYADVASFLQAHGYTVSNVGTELTISNRTSTSFTGSNSPTIYMDDAPIIDVGILRGFSLRDVEEIYINKRGYGGGSSGANGIINIYTKKVRTHNPNIAITSQSLLVLNGFQKWRGFTLPKYQNVRNQGFYNFGTIHWIPNINTDNQGNFSFAFPHLYQKGVKLQIEGIASDGTLVSKIVTLDL